MSTVRRILGFFILACTAFAADETKDFRLKLSLDPLLDLSKTWTVGADEIDRQFQEPGFKKSPFVRWSDEHDTAVFSDQPFTNVIVNLSVLGGGLALSEARLSLDKADGKIGKIMLSAPGASAEMLAKLRLKIAEQIGGEPKPGPRVAVGWKPDAEVQSEVWSSAAGTAVLQTSARGARVHFGRPGMKSSDLIEGSGARGGDGKLEFFVRLDQLLPVPDLWSMTPDLLDAKVSMKNMGLKENPFFKWSTAARDSARFSKDLFGNTKTDVLLFNDTIHAEEVNIEFTNGHASKLVITLISRGNSGRATAAQFNETSGAAARALGAMLGVRPTHTTPAGMMLVKTDGYLWTTPHTLVLLEYNADAPKGQVEFLRLTMTPAAARKQLLNTSGLGNFATTRNLISLMGSVKRDRASGDVEITGIPMRDQGQKGYCVAASCERLLRYLGQPCDMDELAQFVGADAERGTNPRVMYGALAKVDQRYNLHLTLLLIAPDHRLSIPVKNKAEWDHAQKSELGKVIPEAIDHGVPLLWGVELAPGDTGVSPQVGVARPTAPPNVRVGHMRLIIGYNSKTGAVIYTDSWGSGHERKVMPLTDAQRMTAAVFSMTPSR